MRILAGLRSEGVSYLFAGRTGLDLGLTLEILNRELGVKRLILEGGGVSNGAFLRACLVSFEAIEGPIRSKTFLQAAIQITVADLSMSLDNVLLVASIARDEPALLFIGLSFSVLFMGFAANYVARLIQRYHWINYVGLAVILWVACNMIYEGWVGGEHVLGLRKALGLG